MACNKQLIAYQKIEPDQNGNRAISFSPDANSTPLALPCGQCMGCRLDKARTWAMRLHLEGKDHQESCFVTLTYDEEQLPDGQTLEPIDLQRFIKRLRKRISPLGIRYYGVGEYGGNTDRPHYHIIIFGYNFPDRRIHIDRGHYTIDNSALLESLWPFGFATVQNNSLEAAAYVAKYAVKKITGEKAESWYEICDPATGEIFNRHPEFARMSTRPGIGANWMRQYHRDLYPKGYVTDGKGGKMPPPEYFNKLFKQWFPETWEEIRNEKRQEVFEKYIEHNQRQADAREAIKTASVNLRKRKL